jgi:hypothetical protein
MKLIVSLLTGVLNLAATTAPSQAPTDADALAEAVMQASGAAVWPKVTRIRFTFGGRNHHDWDVRNMTDTVTWTDQAGATKTVTVNILNPGDDPDARAAFARWTNDTYWLLAPLKLKDPGVIRTLKAPAEIDGTMHWVLNLSFQGVGLTPNDQYDLYIDPQTYLVRAWDFIRDGRRNRHTWEGYRNFNGLMLSTEHDTGRGKLLLSDIEVSLQSSKDQE